MRITLLVVCVMWACPWVVLAGQIAGDEKADARWQAMPRLPGNDGAIIAMGVDAGGTLWVLTEGRPYWNGKPYWYDGEKWRDAENAEKLAGAISYSFCGGGDRPLVAAVREKGEGAIQVYELRGGQGTLVTDHHLEPGPVPESIPIAPGERQPWVWVSRSGQVFVCCDFQIHVLVEDAWKRLTPRPVRHAIFVDRDDEVVVHYANTSVTIVEGKNLPMAVHHYTNVLCTVSRSGETVEHALDDIGTTEEGYFRFVPWDTDKVLVFVCPWGRSAPSKVYAYEIGTAKPVDIEGIRAVLENHTVRDAFGGPNGSVCLYLGKVGDRRAPISFRVLSSEGDLFELNELDTVDPWATRFWSSPGSTLTASDGTFWFAPLKDGLVAYKDGALTLYGPDDGLPDPINLLAEAPDGTIYAASSDAVWASSPAKD